MKLFGPILILVSVAGFIGCGEGGGSRASAGARCVTNFKPISVDVDEKLKLSLKTGKIGELPAGQYKYVGANIFYRDPANDAGIYLSDVISKKGSKDESFSAKITCARNYRKIEQMGHLAVNVSGVSDLTINADKSVSFEARDYSIDIKNGVRTQVFKKSASKPDAAEKVYAGAADFFMFEVTKDKAYQIRSYYPATKDRGEIYLLISLERSALP